MHDDTLGAMSTMRDQIIIRAGAELTARVDAYAADLRRKTGLRVARAEAVRKLISDALTAAGYPENDEDEKAAG